MGVGVSALACNSEPRDYLPTVSQNVSLSWMLTLRSCSCRHLLCLDPVLRPQAGRAFLVVLSPHQHQPYIHYVRQRRPRLYQITQRLEVMI
jgi:hypothetical protein